MELEQKDGLSYIKMDVPLTQRVEAELSELFHYIERHDPHKIILNCKLMSYVNSSGMNVLFHQYSPLYDRKFSLEIQQANEEVDELLRLANFHLIADISH